MIQIKQKEVVKSVVPILLGALAGKYVAPNGMVIEIFGNQFTFVVAKENNKVTITFSGQKPRITVTKGIFVFNLDFQGRISKVSFDSLGGSVELDGLPTQYFEFI